MKIPLDQIKNYDPQCPDCGCHVVARQHGDRYSDEWDLFDDIGGKVPHVCETKPEVMPDKSITLPAYLRDIFEKLRNHLVENDNPESAQIGLALVDRLEKFCRERQQEHETGSEIAGQLAGHYGWDIH